MMLILHLLGAIPFFSLLIAVWYKIAKHEPVKKLNKYLNIVGLIQCGTGILLSITSHATLSTTCTKLGMYIVFWWGTLLVQKIYVNAIAKV
jgi:hypothetical protein